MGVIIKDMTMPDSCCKCEFSVFDDLVLRCFLTNMIVENFFLTRHNECPLEESAEV